MSETSVSRPGSAVLVRGRLEEPLSRWLWLVKWLLLIPHYIVLAFLGLAFVLVTVVAFVAILVTGRYPPTLFAFNLGVLRWSWRVGYYGYSGLATDRYPPFSLGEEPDYPATLDIAYPAHLSRGLALVKWWLLAIPHYIVLGILTGGTSYTVTSAATGDRTTWTMVGASLLGLLVLFAAVGLLFTGRYPRGLYDFAIGIDRWVMRVVAYVALMTDDYPPFRLDQGGAEPSEPHGPSPWSGGTGARAAMPGTPTAGTAAGPHSGGSRAGAVVALVVGVIVGVTGVGLAAVGGGGLWLQSRRDAAGFVSTSAQTVSSPTAAITIEGVNLQLGDGAAAWVGSDRFGTVRIRATGAGGSPVFIGIGPESAIGAWLAPVAHDQVRDITQGTVTYTRQGGGQTSAPSPTAQTFWSASVSGPGTQELRWPARTGRWAVVLARPDGSPGVRAQVDLGASIPGITGLSTGLLIGGLVLLAGGVVLVALGASGLGRPAPVPSGATPGSAPGSPLPPPPPAPRPASPVETGTAEESGTGRSRDNGG